MVSAWSSSYALRVDFGPRTFSLLAPSAGKRKPLVEGLALL
jgi:hypothetical protein